MDRSQIESLLEKLEEKESNTRLSIFLKGSNAVIVTSPLAVEISYRRLRLAMEDELDWVTIKGDEGSIFCIKTSEIMCFQYRA